MRVYLRPSDTFSSTPSEHQRSVQLTICTSIHTLPMHICVLHTCVTVWNNHECCINFFKL